MGSDSRNTLTRERKSKFQSTLPRGERHSTTFLISDIFQFQSTLPRGERLCHSKCLPASFIDFNPHSRVGSDGAGRGSRQIYSISIHTPAWGATKDSTVLGHIIRISIHTPAWGATCLQKFCSHHREISIHTPAWGATAKLHKSNFD